MDSRIPAILQPLLADFSGRIEQDLPGRVSALYLEGSLALDGFNPRLSDIDFIAVLTSLPAHSDFERMLGIHRALEKKYPGWKLSGMYFQEGDLGCQDHSRDPFLKYHDGKLQWSDHFGLSSVTWWILKNRGIALFGPAPQELDFSVDMDHLIQIQYENLNTYWASWTTRLDGILALVSDRGVQWTVLGVLRQYYTVRERQITSKIQAGEYALTCLPEKWHPIIREAIALRSDPKQSFYPSRIKRAIETYHFLKYVIQTYNTNRGASLPG